MHGPLSIKCPLAQAQPSDTAVGPDMFPFSLCSIISIEKERLDREPHASFVCRYVEVGPFVFYPYLETQTLCKLTVRAPDFYSSFQSLSVISRAQ